MEPFAYIHLAMSYEENPHTDTQPQTAVRKLNWWQMSSTTALMLVIIFGGFTRVVSAFASPVETPIEQQATQEIRVSALN